MTVDQGVLNPDATSHIGDIVQVTPGIPFFVVNGGRHGSVLHGQADGHHLHDTRGTKRVTTHRLDRRDGYIFGLSAECQLDRGGFGDVVIDHRVAVGADVVNITGTQAR